MVTYFMNCVKGVFTVFFRVAQVYFGILCTMKHKKESSVRTAGTVLALIPTLKGLGFSAHYL